MGMERGFGWHYPPGTPGPRSEWDVVTCENGHQHTVKVTTELGATDADPEDCPECGSLWDWDTAEPMEDEDV